ncbi:MAG TPA: SAM-dependent chlorinase/fluorinase [Candidatus Methylomirabilis sp.]|jgi:S-adenosylmethionine hydrolase
MSTKNSPRGRPPQAPSPLITLFTDFGLGDPFVGVMKAVILGVCPSARIVDLGHEAARFDPVSAGFALATAVPYFPPGTIHVAVVDPGVGGARRPLAARIDGRLFLAPDNGLLAWLLTGAGRAEVRQIADPRLMRRPVSATFHGRDVFAPAAAHLARGHPFVRVGPVVADPVCPPLPRPAREPGPAVRGQVVWVDRFGNLITNVDAETLAALGPAVDAGLQVEVGGRPAAPVVSHYGAVAPGTLGAALGSSGHLELFVNRGSAAALLGGAPGTPLRVRPAANAGGRARGGGPRTGR